MAAIRQGIIKKSRVEATDAACADEVLFGTALRVPKDRVRLEAATEDAPSAQHARAVYAREVTVAAAEPYQIPAPERPLQPEPVPETGPEPESDPPHEPTPEEIEAAWEVRLDEARNQAFDEGREAGAAAADAEFAQQLAELNAQFAQDLDAVQQSWERHLRRMEPQIVELTFRLAGAVIDAPVHDEVRQIAERSVADAVERMATDIPVEIMLHPVSYLRIQESGVEEQLEAIHSRLRWRTDEHLKQNEWIVQSQRAATRRIEAEVIDQLQRELNVRDLRRGWSATSEVESRDEGGE